MEHVPMTWKNNFESAGAQKLRRNCAETAQKHRWLNSLPPLTVGTAREAGAGVTHAKENSREGYLGVKGPSTDKLMAY